MRIKTSAIWRLAATLVLILSFSVVNATPVAADNVTTVTISSPTTVSPIYKQVGDTANVTFSANGTGNGNFAIFLGTLPMNITDGNDSVTLPATNVTKTFNVTDVTVGVTYDIKVEVKAEGQSVPAYNVNTAAVIIGNAVTSVVVNWPGAGNETYVQAGGSKNVNYTTDGNGAGQVQILFNGTLNTGPSAKQLPAVNATGSYTVPLGTLDGTYNLSVQARWDPSGAWTTGYSNSSVVVDSTPPAFNATTVITSPTPGVGWEIGSPHDITWNSTVTEANQPETPITLQYSSTGADPWTTIGSSLLNNGTYPWTVGITASTTAKIKIIYTDKAGNSCNATSSFFTVYVVDNTLPHISIDAPPNGNWVKGNITVNATAYDNQSTLASIVMQYYNGTAWVTFGTNTTSPASNVLDTHVIADGGALQIKATATNGVGAYRSVTNTYYVDNSAPTGVVITQPTTGSLIWGSYPVEATAADAESGIATANVTFQYYNGTAWLDIAGTTYHSDGFYYIYWDTSGVPDGSTYQLRANATNNVGLSTVSAAITGIIVDNTAPANLALTSPIGGEAWKTGTVHNITWVTPTDAHLGTSPVTIDLYNGNSGTYYTSIASGLAAVGPYVWTVPSVIPDDYYYVYITATDLAGNPAVDSSEYFIIWALDSTPPSVTLFSPTNNANVTGSFEITATASDPESNIQDVDFDYSTNGGSSWTPLGTDSGAGPSYSYYWNPSSITASGVIIRATARNGVGLKGSDQHSGIIVDNSNPSVSLTSIESDRPHRDNIYKRGTLTVNADASDAGTGIAEVDFSVRYLGCSFSLSQFQSMTPSEIENGDWSSVIGWVPGHGDGTYSVEWYTDEGPDGAYLVKAKAFDGVDRTARDYKFVIVDNTPPTMNENTLISPNGGESWQRGSTHDITWVAGDIQDENFDHVDGLTFYYSIDDGESWTQIDDHEYHGGPFNAFYDHERRILGTYSWVVTAPVSNLCVVKIVATDKAGNTNQDYSDNLFSIYNVENVAPTVTVNSPKYGESYLNGDTRTITWTATDDSTPADMLNIHLSYTTDGGDSWQNIAYPLNSGAFPWTVPSSVNSTQCVVMVQATDEASNTGTGLSGVFSISPSVGPVDTTPPAVVVNTPNGGQSFIAGSTQIIGWTATDDVTPAANINIELYYTTDGGVSWNTLTTSQANTGVYAWTTPPVVTSSLCLVKVVATDEAGNSAFDLSNSAFSISPPATDNVPPVVEIDTPVGGENFAPGTTRLIGWEASDNVTPVANVSIALSYSTNGGGSWTAIATPANTGDYAWTVPAVNSTLCLVKVVAADVAGNSAFDVSDNAFTIAPPVPPVGDTAPPVVVVNTPNGGENFVGGSIQVIGWTATDNISPVANITIALSYSTNGGGSWTAITSTTNTGTYAWTTPAVTSSLCLVKVVATDMAGNSAFDISNSAFTIAPAVGDIVPPVVMVNTPNGGESFVGGSTQVIGWTATDNVTPVANITIALSYSTNGGGAWTAIATPANTGSYAWTVPAVNSTLCLVKVVAADVAGNSAFAISNNAFTISTPGATPVPVTTISLANGWNLISLPLIPTNSSVLSVLAPVMGNVTGVYYYNAANATPNWLTFVPGSPASNLAEMKDGKGYWIHTNATLSLPIIGTELPPLPASGAPSVPPTYSLVIGWNMLGFKSTLPRPVMAYLAAVSGQYTRIYGFNNGSYFAVDPTSTLLQPTYGYWIAMTGAGVVYP